MYNRIGIIALIVTNVFLSFFNLVGMAKILVNPLTTIDINARKIIFMSVMPNKLAIRFEPIINKKIMNVDVKIINLNDVLRTLVLYLSSLNSKYSLKTASYMPKTTKGVPKPIIVM
jgi:hypothetical protein